MAPWIGAIEWEAARSAPTPKEEQLGPVQLIPTRGRGRFTTLSMD
jgi:hypothetical protein